MKKTLALVLALAMVFSTFTVAFAEGTLGEDAQICKDLGMLKGPDGTVDAAYVATAPTRMQAAIMFLRLKGLEAEALAYTGEDNFADGNIAWAEGANLLAYLKANPQLGWQGDGTNFDPDGKITAQMYYKVLLEALGYKQSTAEVVGDFEWANVLEFAAGKGLVKVAAVAEFTVNDLAIATVEALKVNVKGTEAALYKSLVAEEAAVAAGLVEAAPVVVAAEIDEVEAIGSKVVQVVFKEDVDAASAGNIDNYAISGLTIEEVVVAGPDSVRLYTALQTVGKLYTLTMGEQSAKFAGIAKVSDGPQITKVSSEDVNEVVAEFDRNLDFATATDVAIYDIKGVTVVSAEIDPDEPDEVILTTEGLKDNTDYTLKVTNIKSVDLSNRKTNSKGFRPKYDVATPKLKDVKADTNERVIVTFTEKVSKESAEDLANYSIKVKKKDGEELGIVSIEWDSDDKDNVEIVTESMDKKVKEYELTVSNIADRRKVPNVMTRAYSKTFEPKDVDTKAPTVVGYTILSPTKFMLEFKDDSRLDAASVLDINNYEFECDGDGLNIENIEEYTNKTGKYVAIFTVEEMITKKCKLTYVDIMDEFGNAMKEDSKSWTPNLGNFASAKLDEAKATGENTIILTFDNNNNNLDEASAENIANYTINKGIGTPTKAEFEYKVDGVKQEYKVRLTVNDLVSGKTYKLSIDGLKDLAGNELVITDYVITMGSNWDEKVELDGADAICKYVVALSFKEEVKYATGASVILTKNKGDTAASPGAVTLLAKAMNDDDTVIEFSDYGNKVLDTGVTYYVYHVAGVTNKGGTSLTFTPDEYSFIASENDKPDYAEFDSIEQIDADTVKVVMSRNVKKAADDTNHSFVVTVDDEVAYFRLAGGIVEDKDYTLNLWKCLTDEHDIPAVDDYDDTYSANHIPTGGKTDFEGDDADKIKPRMEKVVALSRKYVEVTFDEYLESVDSNKFEIVNIDDNNNKVRIASVVIDETFEGCVVEITLTDPLEARYEYELKLKADAVVDFAGNKSDVDNEIFDGSNLSQY